MSMTLKDILQHSDRSILERKNAKPFIKWAGGKRSLLHEIATRLPKRIETYWEPFLGGGAVFFALESLIENARLSDVNSELALAYQTVRNHPQELIDLLSHHAERHDKKYYLNLRKMSQLPTAVEVSARFIYLNKTCYNGLYRVNRQGEFNVPMGSYKNPTICDSASILAASEVLSKATIRIGDFGKISPTLGDFVYADPPYDAAFNGYASNGFSQDEQERLRNSALRWHGLGASVMLSNADTPFIRSIYTQEPFVLHQVSAPRNINSNPNGRDHVGELLITTYTE